MKKTNKPRRKERSAPAPRFSGKGALVIPCYNEADRIPQLVSSLKKFEANWQGTYEVIAVNDGSSDDTLSKLQAQLPQNLSKAERIEVIDVQPNQGKGNALKTGVEKAQGDFVLTLDADMATSPTELNNLSLIHI